jgi:hypothetical protein
VNLFDRLQATAFDVVTATIGYDASWSPSIGGTTQQGKVLLKNPTEAKGYLGNQDYNLPEFDPNHWIIEYRSGIFNGLKESADNRNTEYVTVNGQQFFVKSVSSKYDGKNLIAALTPHNP